MVWAEKHKVELERKEIRVCWPWLPCSKVALTILDFKRREAIWLCSSALEQGLDGFMFFSLSRNEWIWLSRWTAGFWIKLLICLDSMGWIEGWKCVHWSERVRVSAFLVRECISVLKWKKLKGLWCKNPIQTGGNQR